MPEFPDVVVYIEALERFVHNRTLERVRVVGPSLVKTFDPPLSAVEGRTVHGFRRLGKKIAFEFDPPLFLVLHLMIAGRLRWQKPQAKLSRKMGLAAFDFEHGTLVLTEASPRKRASLWVVSGAQALSDLDPGGIEIFECSAEEFRDAMRRSNHTVKRALTDPSILSGIGNAYSDEILHHARMSPFKQTQKMSDEDLDTLLESSRETLDRWVRRTRDEVGDRFPDKVTAFREGMAVHGRFGQPCPDCSTPVQRLAYAAKEANYCPQCQTGGKLLADRALSRLMRSDWPRTLEELETRKSRHREGG